jgi:hypothetical protein
MDILHINEGRLAQLGEHNVRNVGVGGSNPLPSTIFPPHYSQMINIRVKMHETLFLLIETISLARK